MLVRKMAVNPNDALEKIRLLRRRMPEIKARRFESLLYNKYSAKDKFKYISNIRLPSDSLDVSTKAILLCIQLKLGSSYPIQQLDLKKLLTDLRVVGRHSLIAEVLLQASESIKSSRLIEDAFSYFYRTQDLGRYEKLLSVAPLNIETEVYHKISFNLNAGLIHPLTALAIIPSSAKDRLLKERFNLLIFQSERLDCTRPLINVYLSRIHNASFPPEIIISLIKIIIRKRLPFKFYQSLRSIVKEKYHNIYISEEFNLWCASYLIRKCPTPLEAMTAISELGLDDNSYTSVNTHLRWKHNPLRGHDLKPYEVYRSIGLIDECSNGKVVISGAVWGDSIYVDGLVDLALESLFETGELAILEKSRGVFVSVHTTHESAERVIKKAKVFEERTGTLFRILTTLGNKDDEAISNRANGYMLALADATIHQQVYVGLCPDGVYGVGLAKLVERLDPGEGAFGTLLRVSKKNFLQRFGRRIPSLIREYNRTDTNRHLIEIGLGLIPHECMIYSVKNRFPYVKYDIESFNSNFFASAYMNLWAIRPTHELLNTMAEISSPRYNSPYLEHLAQPIDHELAHALYKKGKLVVPTTFDEFVFLELTEDRGYSDITKSLELPLTDDFLNQHNLQVPITKEYKRLIKQLKNVEI